MKKDWHVQGHTRQRNDAKIIREPHHEASSQRDRASIPTPPMAYRADAELSPEALRIREFLRNVLSIDYGISADGRDSYPHDEYFHYAAVLYDRYNQSRVRRRDYGTLASRSLDLSATSAHLMLNRHVYGPALQLDIKKEAIEVMLMRYLHFADPIRRTYISSIPGPRTEEGTEALIEKVTSDRTIIKALFSDQFILQSFERAITRVALDHFPADHPLRCERAVMVKDVEKAKQESMEIQAVSEKARHDAHIDLPEYVRWLNWLSRLIYR
ncbi:hypothetical protein Slin15195_G004940 [Septoria linicola]|uniref:Uncharacterized protein n=1 Tax=Septoria linicola TaxID=215465 RepID=A0A9Q9EDU4_9PEZI|nr:hypothetical protein Slin14017_G004980 [Septoria linicola]USW47175.1 hypothetical protein Slin15195_G004940 [Septoria linicola]